MKLMSWQKYILFSEALNSTGCKRLLERFWRSQLIDHRLALSQVVLGILVCTSVLVEGAQSEYRWIYWFSCLAVVAASTHAHFGFRRVILWVVRKTIRRRIFRAAMSVLVLFNSKLLFESLERLGFLGSVSKLDHIDQLLIVGSGCLIFSHIMKRYLRARAWRLCFFRC